MPSLDIIEIDDRLAYNAKLLASNLSEPQLRKRGMIDMLGVNCAISYQQKKKLRIDTKKSVYNIPKLFEEFKISDIYYSNYRIDVITLYKEKTVKIPKIHSEVDIIPDFYFIVQIGAKIKEAKMIGFIEGKSILGCSSDSKFFYPSLDLIFDLKKFLQITKRSNPSRSYLGKHADCLGLFLKFIDNDLSSVYKAQLIQHLMNCEACRSRFIDVMDFENIADNVRHYPHLVKKYEQKLEVEPIQINEQVNELEQNLNKAQISNMYVPEEDENTEIVQEENPKKQTKQEIIQKVVDKNVPVENKNKVIDTIFNEMRHIEIPQFKTIIKSKHRHKILALLIMFVFFIGFALISVKGVSNLKAENSKIADMEETDLLDDEDEIDDISDLGTLYNEDNPTHQARLITRQKDIEEFNIQQPVETKPVYSPNVEKIAWEVDESLVKKPNYTKFLQLAGKNIKLNLQNELLLINDVPINKQVMVNIKIASNGDVQGVKIAQKSGSPSIDSLIKRVVKDTLKYMKPPAHGIIAKPVEVSLTLELR